MRSLETPISPHNLFFSASGQLFPLRNKAADELLWAW
jgi:hypothetical protein